ncbi:TolC family outer membrane protein [Microvirga sp. SYSU G3D207]|uniref:TolC family outer membrane protein n=2 Tax=Microvirga arsenatis TaxID=2692265 RepID=A0ABW9YS88_9HYPH|nr:TolC family outer membrane protein [Microvirga arsenatis]NBJ10101.1 TolC family outer membrane protein [Microvirga arsenatis]NBJ23169.1 TolC family outer membrane protein [Microvirga arsenatis]
MTSLVVLTAAGAVSAETLESALARAYGNNPQLNAQRAGVRVADEDVAQAKSGYRPRINATADVGRNWTEAESPASRFSRNTTSRSALTPRGFGVEINQPIFDGFQTSNRVRAAESNVLGSRETLNNTEQTVLLDAATAYMDVLQDTAVLDLQRNNVEVIDEQLRQTRDRFNVGEVTRTDVAQAEARLAAAQSDASQAEATLRASIAQYRQIVGVEPSQLAPGRPLDRLTPRSLDAAVKIALSEHPAIKARQHAVDVAELQVKIQQGALAPQLGVAGSVDQRYDRQTEGDASLSASVVARLTVPIYEGGQAYAATRQAKETVAQRRLEADATRDQVRAAVMSSWGSLEAARAQIQAAQAQIDAAETALSGVREEARVGQRTTLDVLNAQQELLDARVNLIRAQRARVVASYNLVSAMGRLNSRALGLKVNHYSPKIHYDQVKDLWIGTSTPDGR